jgi:hypothetical protein
MSFSFPSFTVPIALDERSSFIALFDSYDQRHDDCYYRVTWLEGGQARAPFMVVIGLEWAGDDWSSPTFAARLQRELTRAAATGKPNTDYAGMPSKV